MRLFHGSNVQIDVIDLQKSKKAKDFGKGFYLSKEEKQAQKMAELTTFRMGCGKPMVSVFEFDEKYLSSPELKVKIFEYYTEEWADFIVLNRNNTTDIPAHPYDIVIGPIADDAVGAQLRRFTLGYIDISQLVRELSYIKGPTIQYFFGTERAIQLLKKTK